MKERLINWEPIELFPNDEHGGEKIDDDDIDYLDKERKELSPTINISGGPKLTKLVQSPLGIFALDDTFHPMRGLEVYVAHVNFPITENTLQDLNGVDGIEILKQIGRYRLLFVFGAMFDTEEVILEIESKLNISTMPDEEDCVKVHQIFESEIKQKITSDYWAAYVFPNGRYKMKNVDSKEKMAELLSDYALLREVSGGIIYTSEEEQCD